MKIPDYIEIDDIEYEGYVMVRFSKKYARWHKYEILETEDILMMRLERVK